MGKANQREIVIHADLDEFPAAQAFFDALLARYNINKTIASETMMVFEALLASMLMQGFGPDTE